MNRVIIIVLLLFFVLPKSIQAQEFPRTFPHDQERRIPIQQDRTELARIPKMVVSDTCHDFGDVLIHDPLQWELTLDNTASDTGIIYTLQTQSPVFFVNHTTGIVPEHASLVITVTFNPREAGFYVDTLRIHSSDPDASVFNLILMGNGVLPTQEEILVSVFPNPFTPNGDGFNDYVEFSFSQSGNRPPVIQIFNLRGKMIHELDGYTDHEYRWYGTDSQGHDVEPGVYIFVLTLENHHTSNGTITLIR